MAAIKADSDAQRPAATMEILARRVSEARWPILAAALVATALYLAGLVPPLAALGVFGIVTAAALLPRPARAEPLAVGNVPLTTSADPAAGRFADALPDPAFILDRRGIVRYANALALAAFPVRRGDPLTFRLRAPDLVSAFDRVAKGGLAERVEFSERVPTERWYAAWFSPISGARVLDDLIILIIEDLTERRRIEKIRVDFVANASHELRTPLASLAGFIETLLGPARDDPAARARFLQIMHEQATRMSRLVDDLLSLSRIEMKAHVRPSGNADLGAIVRHLNDALEPLAREMGVTLETHAPDVPVIVTGDRDDLTQVFENLIENACKYGRSGKRVVVTVSPPGGNDGATVSVRDYGPGIASDHLPRLTERFYRVEAESGRQHRGTGLGLAIAKHTLNRHQARLVIESQPGEGATFTVIFPQALVATRPPEPAEYR